ncbi:hypothetical protein FHG87_003135 [Trinorchestia longiramus]|nr:hypothetical protein FHG87_003135 [Trinorchestia longiramus]
MIFAGIGMTRYLILSLLACVAVTAVHGGGGLDDLWVKYGGIKIMKSCLTRSGTKAWIEQLQKALTDCNARHEGRSLFVRSVEDADWGTILDGHSAAVSRQRRSPVFTVEKIRKIKDKLSKKIEIYRCVMQEVGVNDADNAVSTDSVIAQYRKLNISKTLLADIETAVTQCHAYTECLPLEGRKDLPVPADVIKTKAFLECEKYLRYWACLKDDVKSKVAKGMFDFKGLDGHLNHLETDEARAVAIMAAEELVGPDSFHLYE